MATELMEVVKREEERNEIFIPSSEEEGPIICSRGVDMKEIEETQDCFILDFNPFDSIHLSNLSITAAEAGPSAPSNSSDLLVISQKGQVACRDYPHSRHLYVKLPFDRTPHERHCELCYCYVCDSAAPCKFWTDPQTAHCHAREKNDHWDLLRKSRVFHI